MPKLLRYGPCLYWHVKFYQEQPRRKLSNKPMDKVRTWLWKGFPCAFANGPTGTTSATCVLKKQAGANCVLIQHDQSAFTYSAIKIHLRKPSEGLRWAVPWVVESHLNRYVVASSSFIHFLSCGVRGSNKKRDLHPHANVMWTYFLHSSYCSRFSRPAGKNIHATAQLRSFQLTFTGSDSSAMWGHTESHI